MGTADSLLTVVKSPARVLVELNKLLFGQEDGIKTRGQEKSFKKGNK